MYEITLAVSRWRGGKAQAAPDEDAIAKACRYHGMCALVSSHVADAGEALGIYRERERVEGHLGRLGQDCDGKVTRTRSAENPGGRLFVHLVALCYLEELHNGVRDMKAAPGREKESQPTTRGRAWTMRGARDLAREAVAAQHP